jgi:hypothetical protein
VSRIPHALDRFAMQTSDDQVALTPLQLEFTRALQQVTPSSGVVTWLRCRSGRT